MWLNKDIRNLGIKDSIGPIIASSNMSPTSNKTDSLDSYELNQVQQSGSFKSVLNSFNVESSSPTQNNNTIAITPSICATFSLNSLSSDAFPGQTQLRSCGLTAAEASDICFLLGRDKNVSQNNIISSFSPFIYI